MHADKDTVCAGLLHDVIEDTNITKEDIAENFNKEVSKLVDGVTKISKLNFSSKQEQNVANTRKIITGIIDIMSYGPRKEWIDKVQTIKVKKKNKRI